MRNLAILLLFSLSGCIVLPIPAPADKPRFTTEQISALVPGTTTRESVTQLLGAPTDPEDFVRLGGKHWVYTWRQRGAGRIFAVGIGAVVKPMSDHQFALFLRFDESGLLQHRSLVDWRPTNPLYSTTSDLIMCNAEATCIEHPVGRDAMTGLDIFMRDPGSAFTVPGDLGSTHPAADHCALVLWLDKEDWTTPSEHATQVGEQPPGGINVDYTIYDAPASTTLTSWLPVGAYVVIALQAGDHAIRLRNPWVFLEPLTQVVPFGCVADTITYVSMGARSKKFGEEFGVIWREVTPESALVQLQGMRQLLLRDQ
jgi:outer membrane protein assembly factor BamE (lipoprotein component of BamABCDE complex)